jgi:pyruvate dehydrogenase E1 component alpha subunit
LSGHSRGDPRGYRTPEEERYWWNRDPIRQFRKVLTARNLLTRSVDTRLRREARDLVRESVRFAKGSRDPDPNTLEEGVFA